jgi:CBS domain-containing protein
MTTLVSRVLKDKGRHVVTATPENSVASVIDLLIEHRIGAVPVLDKADRVVGMFSERDVVSSLAKYGAAALTLSVQRVMTRQVKTCAPDDTIVGLMEVMTHSRIRHLPVVENGALHGIVSIGDVVKQRLEEAQSEVEALRNYITA